MPHLIEQHSTETYHGVIEKYWLLPRRGGPGRWILDAPPDGNFNLVIALGQSCCSATLVGPFTKPQRIPLLNQCDYFCVLFRPGMLPRIADVTARELVDNWVEVPKLLGVGMDELGEKLAHARDLTGKQRLVEGFLLKAGLGSALPRGTYLHAAELVAATRGKIRVERLAERVGATTRTLERLFREHAGMPPKMLIRLVRFQNVLAQLRSGASFNNLANLASEWGYSDQSHFIRDFRSLMQTSPGAI